MVKVLIFIELLYVIGSRNFMADTLFDVDGDAVAAMLPSDYIYKVTDFKGQNCSRSVYVNLLNERDVAKWLESYQQLTKTQWTVRSTYPNVTKLAFRKDYVCHRFSKCKCISTASRTRSGERKRTGCKASLTVRIFNGRRNKQVKAGLCASITFHQRHNHPTQNATAVSFLRPHKALRLAFEEYFLSGMGIAKSIKFHQNKMKLDKDFKEQDLLDASLCPKYHQVRYWHELWVRKTGSGKKQFAEGNVDSECLPATEDTAVEDGCKVPSFEHACNNQIVADGCMTPVST